MATRIRSEHRSGFTELEIETVSKDDTVKIMRRIHRFKTTEVDIEINFFVKEDCDVESKTCSLLTKKWLEVIGILIGLLSLLITRQSKVFIFKN